MKTSLEFLKTTTLGGLFVLLPLVLFGLVVGEMVDLAIALATPIADLFPEGSFDRLNFPLVLAVVLILATSFLAGLVMRSRFVATWGRWVERLALLPLPGYQAIKSLTLGLSGAAEAEHFQPVLLSGENGQREIAYLIEDHGNGHATVLVPWSPTPMAGSVKMVPRSQLEPLAASLADVTRVLSYWGVGAGELVAKGASGAGTTDRESTPRQS